MPNSFLINVNERTNELNSLDVLITIIITRGTGDELCSVAFSLLETAIHHSEGFPEEKANK